MADIADLANDQIELHTARSIAAARKPMIPGEPGTCRECGDDMPRLVFGRCAPCRDGRR